MSDKAVDVLQTIGILALAVSLILHKYGGHNG